jgi:hypothetical protein
VTLKEDHAILYNGQPAGKWECKDPARNAAILRWTTGNFVDSVTVSGDHINGVNQQGVVISGTRRQRPASITSGFSAGYSRGLKENRYIIMYFRSKSKFTEQQDAEVLKLRSDPVMSAIFVFADALLPDDEYGLEAAKKLKIENIPAISVFAPKSDQLLEINHYEGIWKYEEIRDDIPKSMCKAQQDGKIKLDEVTTRLMRCGAG